MKNEPDTFATADFSPPYKILFNNFYIHWQDKAIKLNIKNVSMEDCR